MDTHWPIKVSPIWVDYLFEPGRLLIGGLTIWVDHHRWDPSDGATTCADFLGGIIWIFDRGRYLVVFVLNIYLVGLFGVGAHFFCNFF